MRNHVEKFLVLFNRLKSELNNSLKNLKWLPKERPEIAELCYQLDETYRLLSRALANKSEKYLVVPSVLQKSWDDYEKYYQVKVEEVAKPLREKYEKELYALFQQLENDAKEKGQSDDEFRGQIAKSMPFAMGSTFNPVEDDAASLLDDIFVAIHDIVDNDLFSEVFTDKQMGALNYFEEVIGINFHAINRRWAKAPNLFISDKIKKKTDKLIEMYNEAVKTYIFGLNVASTAMCRALLEHILINYYSFPKDDIVKIVSLAENKFGKLKSLNLHKLRMDGNEVLHEYEANSKIEEDAVVNYLLTIRALVDFIPG
jgi:hypothetical protein